MKKVFSFIAIATVLGFSGFCTQAKAATNGKALYQAKCAACHGTSATGGVGPDVVGKSGEAVAKAIDKVPMMKSLKSSIGKADANAIGNYLQSLKK
ncbi:cytochrome c [bacterium BMS3Bbin14]|nr:cytochrome c [bacterium BMS3Abin13]GBE53643.1 cytochrome c [bacterium BMS3Bbin14]HDO30649.1 c-type cytochrome [Desulfobacteraceae bacterium]